MLLRTGQAFQLNCLVYTFTHRTIPQFTPIRHLSCSPTRRAAAGQGKPVTSHAVTPKKQLERMVELQQRTAAANSMIEKAAIIGEYPDLRELLEYVYQPNLRLHIQSNNLRKFLPDTHFSKRGQRNGPSGHQTLVTLFDSLSRRTVTGTEAKAAVATFLFQHDIIQDSKRDSPEFEVFCRLLDRNLKSGFGAAILEKVSWNERRPRGRPRSSAPTGSATDPSPAITLKRFSCALSKSISAPFDELFKDQDREADNEGAVRWYASRKLDGVRCITYIDIFVPDGRKAPSVIDVKFLSRSGKEFASLSRLGEQIRQLSDFPQLRDWVSRDPVSIAHRVSGDVKRLVLDGEVCVMKKVAPTAAVATSQDDDGVGSMWESDGMIEDFTATVSQVKRKKPIEHPRYYLFDVLSWAEFSTKGAYPASKLGLDFRARIRDIKNLTAFLESSNQEPMVHALAQLRVRTIADVDAAVKRAASEGWEGVMFRANAPYVGKRSDMYKFKQWQDAEYTVVECDTVRMRLSVNGVFGDYEACSNVWIEHNGHRVSVGSGFTAEQRIRYAKDPEAIVGKQITVQYFGESEASDRAQGVKSLRFPRVKKVWEGKGRDV